MVQVKMKYGIDLGTTNSAICRMENGDPCNTPFPNVSNYSAMNARKK